MSIKVTKVAITTIKTGILFLLELGFLKEAITN